MRVVGGAVVRKPAGVRAGGRKVGTALLQLDSTRDGSSSAWVIPFSQLISCLVTVLKSL